jgi:hypothetical protein
VGQNRQVNEGHGVGGGLTGLAFVISRSVTSGMRGVFPLAINQFHQQPLERSPTHSQKDE